MQKDDSLAIKVMELSKTLNPDLLRQAVGYMSACCKYYAIFVERPTFESEYIKRESEFVLEMIEEFLKTGKKMEEITPYER